VLDNSPQIVGKNSHDLDLVADAVSVLEQNRQAREIVVDLVLAADCDSRSDEPGTRKEESRIEFENVEHGNDDTDPQDNCEKMVQHTRRRVDSLALTVLRDALFFVLAVSRPGPPPLTRTSKAPIGDVPHDASNEYVR
jgi:hypothetical protein